MFSSLCSDSWSLFQCFHVRRLLYVFVLLWYQFHCSNVRRFVYVCILVWTQYHLLLSLICLLWVVILLLSCGSICVLGPNLLCFFFASRPTKEQFFRLRIHHRSHLVYHPVKLYADEIVSEMNWDWDVDLVSYMQIERMIKSEGYCNIRCLWYLNPKFLFFLGTSAFEKWPRHVKVHGRC